MNQLKAGSDQLQLSALMELNLVPGQARCRFSSQLGVYLIGAAVASLSE